MYEDLFPDEFARRLKEDPAAELIDVRTSMEYFQERIPGAQLLDISSPDFFDRIQQLPRDRHYYVYCRSGARSAQAALFMAQLGLTAFNLAGGILNWNGETTSGEE